MPGTSALQIHQHLIAQDEHFECLIDLMIQVCTRIMYEQVDCLQELSQTTVIDQGWCAAYQTRIGHQDHSGPLFNQITAWHTSPVDALTTSPAQNIEDHRMLASNPASDLEHVSEKGTNRISVIYASCLTVDAFGKVMAFRFLLSSCVYQLVWSNIILSFPKRSILDSISSETHMFMYLSAIEYQLSIKYVHDCTCLFVSNTFMFGGIASQRVNPPLYCKRVCL